MKFKRNVPMYSLILAVLMIVPLFLPSYAISGLSNVLISALFVLAFSLLLAQGGMLSFGHSAYFAIGAFATLHAMNAVADGNLAVSTPFLPIFGALAGLATGVVAGFFATQRSGVYFSMVTLAIAELFHTVAPNLQTVFGGETGVSSMRMPWAGISFGQEIEVYYLILVWVALCAAIMYLYTQTLSGRVTVALRENERRLAFLGYNVHATKILIFSISSMFTGVAGGLLAMANESASYELFSFTFSASAVLYTYIGGIGTFLGPAIGGAAMTFFGHVVSDMTRLWLLYQGIIFVLIMMYAPYGISGLVKQTDGTERLRDRNIKRTLMLAPMLAITAATVFLCELINTILSRDYQRLLDSTGIWHDVELFGRAWTPSELIVWAVPSAIVILSVSLIVRISRHRRAPGLTMSPQGGSV